MAHMRIVNHTGNVNDTKIYGDDGKELNKELRVTEIHIVAGESGVEAKLTCTVVQLDVVAFEQVD